VQSSERRNPTPSVEILRGGQGQETTATAPDSEMGSRNTAPFAARVFLPRPPPAAPPPPTQPPPPPTEQAFVASSQEEQHRFFPSSCQWPIRERRGSSRVDGHQLAAPTSVSGDGSQRARENQQWAQEQSQQRPNRPGDCPFCGGNDCRLALCLHFARGHSDVNTLMLNLKLWAKHSEENNRHGLNTAKPGK